MSDVLFFKSKLEIKKWFQKNHKKSNMQWFGLYKKQSLKQVVTGADIKNEALCFGWAGIKIKAIDYFSYQIQYLKRKEKSTWSQTSVKEYKQLLKKNQIQPQGQWAFDNRNTKKVQESNATFLKKHIVEFKKNKIAWSFFNSQTASYQKYMAYWVTSAQQDKTQNKRLSELIKDSEGQTKLQRVLKSQEKLIQSKKNRYKIGETPIEEAKNLGPLTGAEFRTFGIDTVEKLKSLGWEKSYSMWVQHYPHRIHSIAAYAIIGAVNNQAYFKLDPELKAEAKNFVKELKYDLRY